MADMVASHPPEWQLRRDRWLDPVVLAVAAPLALFPARFPVAALGIALGLLATPYAVRWARLGRISVAPGATAAVLLLVALALTVGIGSSLDLWGASLPELVRLVWGAAVCLGVMNFCASGPDARTPVQAGFVALGLAFGLVGLLAMRESSKFPLLGQLWAWLPGQVSGRAAWGLSLNPNRVAGLLVLYPAVILAWLLTPGAGRRGVAVWGGKLLLGGLLLCFSLALLLTQSRTALLAGGVSLALVALLAGRRGAWLLGVAALVVLASVSVLGLPLNAVTPARLLADRDVAGRVLLWQRAWYGILDAPLTGVGLNGFHALAQTPYPRLPGFRPDPDITHAHNLLLQTGLDLGLGGVVALLALLALAVRQVIRLYRQAAPDSTLRFYALGLAGGLAALCIFNTLDAVTLGARPAVAQWYLLGLCLGAGAVADEGERR